MSKSVTPRGFVVYDEFEDRDGDRIYLQQSSAIDVEDPLAWERPGSSFLRIYCKLPTESGTGGADTSMHLDATQARRLRDAIDAWLAERAR